MPYRVIYWDTIQDFQDGKEPKWEDFETRNELARRVAELENFKAIVRPQYIDEEDFVTEIQIKDLYMSMLI